MFDVESGKVGVDANGGFSDQRVQQSDIVAQMVG